jgi:signal transduction histidine kinase
MARVDRTLYLLLGWLPMGALFAALVATRHGTELGDATWVGLRMAAVAAPLSILVYRLSGRVPWPQPSRLRFLLVQTAAAALFALAWLLGSSLVESVLLSQTQHRLVLALVSGPGVGPTLVFGVWIYIVVAGVAYAHRATRRSAEAQALAARTQLAALRAQLHPHFLFNALHTVVQLIGLDPPRAVRAAEELAAILRRALDQRADVIALGEEWDFVRRYLAIESLRFGARLQIEANLPAELSSALVPAFALQTLVENAVRHGAAPLTRTTRLQLQASAEGDLLRLRVEDDGAGADAAELERGTGLARLRERLAWLCADAAQLQLHTAPQQGFRAELLLGQAALRAARAREDGDD